MTVTNLYVTKLMETKKKIKAPNLESHFRQGRFVPVRWNALKFFYIFRAPVHYKTLQIGN